MTGEPAQTEEIAMTANTTQTQPPDMIVGVDRYLEFLQRQIKLTGELAATWMSAMNTLSATVLGYGQVGRFSPTDRTLGGSVGLPRLIGARMSQRRTQSIAETKPDDRSTKQEPLSAEVFDEVIELLVDDDIITAISEQAAAN